MLPPPPGDALVTYGNEPCDETMRPGETTTSLVKYLTRLGWVKAV